MSSRRTWRKHLVAVVIPALVLALALPGDLAAQVDRPSSLKLPGGTTIVLRTLQAITPATAKAGDSVPLEVASDVVVDGTVVVRAGAAAKGEVVSSQKRGMVGKPDRIEIRVQSVAAVDGSTVPVGATKSAAGKDKTTMTVVLAILICLPLIFMKGGEASIPAGAAVNAATTGTTEIKVADGSPLSPGPQPGFVASASLAIE